MVVSRHSVRAGGGPHWISTMRETDPHGERATRPVPPLWAVRSAPRRVRLLELQPGLAERLDGRALEQARHAVIARTMWVEAGPWTPDFGPPERCARWLGVLVLDGLISRTVCFDRLGAQELIGPGDLLRPWDDAPETASVPSTREWCVLERARL